MLLSDCSLKQQLRLWRTAKAHEQGWSEEFRVFQNVTIDGLIEQKPKDKMQLLKVKGIGPEKARKYGDELLDIIRRASDEPVPASPAPEVHIPAARSNASHFWNDEERSKLVKWHEEGEPVKTMAALLGRSEYAVRFKLLELGLEVLAADKKRKSEDVVMPMTPAKKAR